MDHKQSVGQVLPRNQLYDTQECLGVVKCQSLNIHHRSNSNISFQTYFYVEAKFELFDQINLKLLLNNTGPFKIPSRYVPFIYGTTFSKEASR